eukprot:10607245-Alexandrium_andersonii.AAC.1
MSAVSAVSHLLTAWGTPDPVAVATANGPVGNRSQTGVGPTARAGGAEHFSIGAPPDEPVAPSRTTQPGFRARRSRATSLRDGA